MIIVGVDNTLDQAKETIHLLTEISQKNQKKIFHLAPTQGILKTEKKSIAIGQYIQFLEQQGEVEILLIEIKKESLLAIFSQSIHFDVLVLFEDGMNEKRKKVKQLKSTYYIVPYIYAQKIKGCVTYGWDKEADISVSSSEKDVLGNIKVQCCVQTCLPTLQGGFIIPTEFPVVTKIQEVPNLLAAIAVLLIIGIHSSHNCTQNNIYKMV